MAKEIESTSSVLKVTGQVDKTLQVSGIVIQANHMNANGSIFTVGCLKDLEKQMNKMALRGRIIHRDGNVIKRFDIDSVDLVRSDSD